MTTCIEIPELTTERLRLRAPRFSDYDAYAAFRGDPVRTRFLGGPYSPTQAFDQLGEAIGHWHLRGYGRFMVADIKTDEPLGIVGPFFPVDWPEPEIAWSVFAKAEGRGIAYEAANAARHFAYTTLGWTTAISMVPKGNQKSDALAIRLGCTPDPDFIHPDYGPMSRWRHPPASTLVQA